MACSPLDWRCAEMSIDSEAEAADAPSARRRQVYIRLLGASLEASRGGEHVLDPMDGAELSGEVDALGWNGRTWTGTTWQNGRMLAAGWTGTSWSGLPWVDHAWSDDQWLARSWRADSWSARSWRQTP